MKKATQIVDVIQNLVNQIGKTLDDVADVNLNHPTDPTQFTILFKDGTQATVDVQRPLNA